MSYMLHDGVVEQAMSIVRPAIETLLKGKFTAGRSDLHLVVLKPGTDEILYEESFGDESAWEHPYDEIARSKARICQRTGMVTRDVKKDAPWLYESGDTRYVGAVIKNELVVAASGLQDHFDEMICRMVFAAIQAQCRDVIYQIELAGDFPDFFA